MDNEIDNTSQKSSCSCPTGTMRLGLPNIKAHLIFWPIALGGVVADLWTKTAIFEWLKIRNYEPVQIIDGILQFVMALNSGAAFGIAAGKRYFLVGISVVALIVILAIFFMSGKQKPLVYTALGLFAAGICGNLYDRIFNDGLVRDFIDVVYWPNKHWPAFNVADSMLCIGVALMLILSFTEKPCQKPDHQQK